MAAFLHQHQAIAQQVIAALEQLPHADWPAGRRHLDLEGLLYLVEQIKRVLGLAIHLVDEGNDRHVAQPANLEEFSGLLLDPTRRVDYHDSRINRRQRPVSILREIHMTGRVEKIEGGAGELIAHHRRGDGNAPLTFDL